MVPVFVISLIDGFVIYMYTGLWYFDRVILKMSHENKTSCEEKTYNRPKKIKKKKS